MIPAQLQPLVDHVWQSTLFAVVAGALTLGFRNNRAQVRYCLWFAASLKFLIPFSLLVGVGGYFGWHSIVTSAPPPLPVAVEHFTESFVVSQKPTWTLQGILRRWLQHIVVDSYSIM